MIRTCNFLAMAAGLLALSAATMTAADPLSMIPADAALVVRVKAPAATTEKVAAYADSVQPGIGRNVRENAAAIGLAISNPALAGVDQSGDWLLTVLVGKNQPPQAVFLIPATDTEAMTKALPAHMTSMVRDEWVIYSEDAETLKAFTAEGESRFVATMGAAAKGSFDKGDVSMFVNVNRLTDVYEQQLEQLREQATSGLNQLQFNLANSNSGVPTTSIIEMYGTLLEGVLQALEDARGMVVAVGIDDSALVIEEFFDFASDSKTSNWLKGHQGSDFPALGKLPADAIAYYGVSGDMSHLYKASFGITASMLSDEAAKEKLKSLVDKFSEFTFGPMVGSFDSVNSQDGAVRAVNIVDVSPARSFRTMLHDVMEQLKHLNTPGISQTTTIAPEAETINGYKVDVITVEQDVDSETDPRGLQKKIRDILFGGEGIVSRQVFLEDRYIQTTGGGKSLMEQTLARIDSDESTSYEAYLQGIVEEPNVLVLVDLPGLAVKALKRVATVPDLNLPITPEMVQGMASPTSYLTFAVKADENTLRFQTRLPATQPRGIMRLVGLFVLLGQQLRQNGL